MKILILIRGLSGSGKTEHAELIVGDHEGRAEITVDRFFEDDNGNYTFDFSRIKEAYEWCKNETKLLLEDEYEVVVVHNSFTRKWEAEPYFDLAKDHGYEVQVISLYDGGLNDKALSERSLHGLTSHQISEQRKRWDLNIHPHRGNRPRNNHARYPHPHHPHSYPPPVYAGYHREPYPHSHPNNQYPRKKRKWSGSDREY